MKNKDNLKEKNLAYGGQALIEGVMMRGQNGYAFTIKKQDETFYKEKNDYIPLSKRIKIFGFPLIRGIVGLFENLVLGMKILNKSAEIAYPDENGKKMSNIGVFFLILLSLGFVILIFKVIPYSLTAFLPINHNSNPILYNFIAGIIRMIFFFIYLILISFLKDAKRIFGYHGAEHKTIRNYESKQELTVENAKKFSRLHPRCGTSFVFIVFILTIVIFPLFNIFYSTQDWYNKINNFEVIGPIIQRFIHIFTQFFIGLPIVAGISYELLRLSGKFEKNPLIKLFIAPGLFFQLFTTKEPDDTMIKTAISSLKMLIGEEKADIEKKVSSKINKLSLSTQILLIPVFLLIL